jgi:hypothetical protein
VRRARIPQVWRPAIPNGDGAAVPAGLPRVIRNPLRIGPADTPDPAAGAGRWTPPVPGLLDAGAQVVSRFRSMGAIIPQYQ